MTDVYTPIRRSRSEFLDVRGLRQHIRRWGDPGAPPLVMLHGWMDVSASFQFVVDRLTRDRQVIAPDWRGFGLSGRSADCYWFPDYVGDLDFMLDALLPERQVDLVGHSMGGNVAMLYAGVRPARVRRLVNLEGYGLPAADPGEAPRRLREWLDQLHEPPTMRDYPTREAVAERLMQTNPRLPHDRARWLAAEWSAPNQARRFELLGDPAHRITNPYLYRVDEVAAVWREISAPVLLVGAAESSSRQRFAESDAYRQRLSVIRDLHRSMVDQAGHMLHHDQPERVASLVEDFVDE